MAVQQSKTDETSNATKSDSSNQNSPLFVTVDGCNIGRFFEKSCTRPMKEHVELLKALELRSDDVLIAAFAKSGTHWIWEMTSMLLAGKAEYEKRTKEFAMMEATKVEKIDSQPSPRVLNSHLPLRLLPLQIKEKKVKVIHVYRNVKDILVSAYFHISQIPGVGIKSFDDVERVMIGPDVPGGDYFAYLKEMEEYKKSNPDVPFFIMSYEDTKEDPETMVKKLAEFLDIDVPLQLCRDIAHATAFSKMKEADKNKQQVENLPQSKMYRKGEVGDWKNYLTVAQSERLDAAMMELQSCDYHFRFTL
ncbi:hypothetical protein ACOMHN_033401 [Nucella lapillus]